MQYNVIQPRTYLWYLTAVALFLAVLAAFPVYSAEKVDINSADAWVLQQKLSGIGKKKAEAIVKYREEHGPFKTVYELEKVHGIGKKTVEKNLDKMVAIQPEQEPEKVEEVEKEQVE